MATTNRLRAQRAIKKRRRTNFRARTGREDSMDERHEQRAEASVASRSESDTTSMPPLYGAGSGREDTRSGRLIRKAVAERRPQRVC